MSAGRALRRPFLSAGRAALRLCWPSSRAAGSRVSFAAGKAVGAALAAGRRHPVRAAATRAAAPADEGLLAKLERSLAEDRPLLTAEQASVLQPYLEAALADWQHRMRNDDDFYAAEIASWVAEGTLDHELAVQLVTQRQAER